MLVHPRRSSVSFVICALLAATSAAAEEPTGPSNEDCQKCHPTDDKWAGSIHGELSLSCTDCHADLAGKALPHGDTVAAAQCATCHDKTVAAYATGVHRLARIDGKGIAATCTGCHGNGHAILASGDRRSPTHHLNQVATCARCHDDAKLIEAVKLPGGVVKSYVDSIHGRAVKEAGLVVAPTCASCHGAHDIKRPDDPQSPMARGKQAASCAKCHVGVGELYEVSVHAAHVAKGDPGAPVCSDCHTAHGIQRSDATAWKLDVIRECGTCHEQSLDTYRDTFHGHVTELGFARMAKCADCHGAHDIVAKNDPRSRVNSANLVETCGACHPGATASFVKYDPHANPSNPKRSAVLYWVALAMKGLLVGVFGFFGLHTLLWLVRGIVDKVRLAPSAGRPGGKS